MRRMLQMRDSGAETEADEAQATDRADATEETATGEFATDEVDYETAKTEWLAVFEQGIHSRERFSALFDVAPWRIPGLLPDRTASSILTTMVSRRGNCISGF